LMFDSNLLMVAASGVQFGAAHATFAAKMSDRINNLFIRHSASHWLCSRILKRP
jgi:hypothetical protein